MSVIRNVEVSAFWRDIKYYVQWRVNLDRRFLSNLMRCPLLGMSVKRGFTV